MPSSILSSELLQGLFGTDAMRDVFSDTAMVQRYLDVEAALARAEARLGLIPAEAAASISAQARVENVDFERLRRRTERAGTPILPLVEQLADWCPDGLGQYCHWGATTQDIMDTADVLQIGVALNLIEADLHLVADHLAELARRHRDTVMAGRTHLQHALPITFGYKAATWLAPLRRHGVRLAELRGRVMVGQFSGAAGTLASLGGQGLAVQDAVMAELGLARPDITWHTARDGFAEATGFLALLTGSLAKIGLDVMLLMQTEVGEVLEPYQPGRGASSTMPQKRNPVASELLVAAAKIVARHHGTMLEAMIQDHERASGPWHAEWQALPDAFIAGSGALAHATALIGGLEVRPERMAANLDLTGGLIMAEAVMMGLAPHLGRQHAHEAVADCCRESLESGRDFLDVLAAHPEIAPLADRSRLAALTDPANYVGAAPQMVDRLLGDPAPR